MITRVGAGMLVASLLANVGVGLLWWRRAAISGEAGETLEAANRGGREWMERRAGDATRRERNARGGGKGDCLQRLERAEGDLERAAEAWRRVLRADRLFQRGAPNEAARVRMAGVLGRVLAGDAGAASHFVECRDYVCRLSVLEPAEPAERSSWMVRLQQDQVLRRHVGPRILFAGGEWVKDPASGRTLFRGDAYMRLIRVDGAAAESAEEGTPVR